MKNRDCSPVPPCQFLNSSMCLWNCSSEFDADFFVAWFVAGFHPMQVNVERSLTATQSVAAASDSQLLSKSS
jgi:hypothetical protein